MAKDQKTPLTDASPAPTGAMPRTRIMFIHGDKGGTGKTMTARVVTDFLYVTGQKVAIVEADTSNPDVKRMFIDRVPTQAIDLRKEEGWMDMMDFCNKHIGYAIIVNLPGGIGDHLSQNLNFLKLFVNELGDTIDTELWWVMNITHDAINLLDKAVKQYGNFFNKIRIVCNLFWTANNKDGYSDWHETELKAALESKNAKTVYLWGMNNRVSKKLFHPSNEMPFSEALDIALGERVGLGLSENFKLKEFWQKNEPWLSDVFEVEPPRLVEKHKTITAVSA